jgi:hypothetical protein
MATIKVSLLGKFSMIDGGMGEYKFKVPHVLDLFICLLVFDQHLQPGGFPCEMLWADPLSLLGKPAIYNLFGSLRASWLDSYRFPASAHLISMARVCAPPVMQGMSHGLLESGLQDAGGRP